jgi:hypothetical protein
MRILTPLIILAALNLTGCEKPVSQALNSEKASVAKVLPPLTLDARKKVDDATETFENLTEQAFSNKPPEVDMATAKAIKAAGDIRGLLSPDGQKALDSQLAAISVAIKTNTPADLSLASNEMFRLAAEASADGADIPLPVTLLDYAGFRYSAHMQANPVRWDEMAKAHDFAVHRWDSVRGQITDKAVISKFTTTLDAMAIAARTRDITAAKKAATDELDMVDILEGLSVKAHK